MIEVFDQIKTIFDSSHLLFYMYFNELDRISKYLSVLFSKKIFGIINFTRETSNNEGFNLSSLVK